MRPFDGKHWVIIRLRRYLAYLIALTCFIGLLIAVNQVFFVDEVESAPELGSAATVAMFSKTRRPVVSFKHHNVDMPTYLLVEPPTTLPNGYSALLQETDTSDTAEMAGVPATSLVETADASQFHRLLDSANRESIDQQDINLLETVRKTEAAKAGAEHSRSAFDKIQMGFPNSEPEVRTAEIGSPKPRPGIRLVPSRLKAASSKAQERKIPRAKAIQSSRVSSRVRRAQTLLRRLGYRPGPADGIYGPKTKRAIRAFQARAGNSVDGRVSKSLLARLERAAHKGSKIEWVGHAVRTGIGELAGGPQAVRM